MDISHVAENIWIASRFYPFDDDMPPNAVVIDCTVLRDDDSDQLKHVETIAAAVDRVPTRSANFVLVCDAGRNRSAVVAAVVLAWRGYDDPIRMVRDARAQSLARTGGALTNETFVELLG